MFGFVGVAAEIAEAGNRPLQADLTHGGGRRDLNVADVADLALAAPRRRMPGTYDTIRCFFVT
jgi:hypothetical protein